MSAWYEQPLRVVQLGIEDRLAACLAGFDLEGFLDDLVRQQVDVLVLQAQNPFGNVIFNSAHLPKQASLGERDLLAEFAKGAHARGLRLVAMVGPTENQHVGQLHPDWGQVSARGGTPVSGTLRVDPEVPTWHFLCINSPYRELVANVIREVLAYAVDGIFVDFLAQWDCRCQHCARIFRERYGAELPHVNSGEVWSQFRAFQSETVRSFAAMARGLIEYVNPDAALVFYAFPFATRLFPEIADVSEYIDVLRIDVHASARQESPGWIGEMVDTSISACHKPVWAAIPCSYNWFIGTAKPAPMLRQELREAVAHGASPYILTFDWAYPRERQLLPALADALPDSLIEQRKHAQRLRQIGVVSSRASRDLLWDQPDRHGDSVRGWYELLSAAHIPVEIVSDTELSSGNLAGYAGLVLPDVVALSDLQLSRLRSFVDGGGGVIASYGTSLYTEDGKERSDFGLTDVLGVHREGLWQEPWSYIQVEQIPGGEAVPTDLQLPIVHGDVSTPFATLLNEQIQPGLNAWASSAVPQVSWAYDRIGLGNLTPQLGMAMNTGHQQRVTLAGAKPWARIVGTLEAYGSSYIPGITPPIPGEVTEWPALTTHQFGGGRVIYSAGQLERLFWRTGLEEYRQLLLAALTWVVPGMRVLTAEAPSTVSVVGWQTGDGAGNHMAIDLINHTYAQLAQSPVVVSVSPPVWYASRSACRPATEAIPVEGISVTVRLPAGQQAADAWAVGCGELTWGQRGSDLVLRLPVLGEHARVTVALESARKD